VQAVLIENLFKWFGQAETHAAVDHIDLLIEQGAMLVLLGPSGCGKTTLLRCVAGLEEAQQGRISLGDRVVFDAKAGLNVATHKRDIGLVFQNYSLWPHMTVEDNVTYPLRARGIAPEKSRPRTQEVLRIVHCDHLAKRLPSMLSGGQQQRIALARALAPRPAIMLLDEPLSNLDALLRVELRQQIRMIHRELGFTGIYVTHDQSEAFALGTRVAVMNSGRIEQIAAAREVYTHPATEYVARFLGLRNILPFDPTAGDTPAGLLLGVPASALRAAGTGNIYIRQENVLIAAGPPPSTEGMGFAGGLVEDAVFTGSQMEYLLRFGATSLHSTRPFGEPVFQRGDQVSVSFPAEAALVYRNGKLDRTWMHGYGS
jgi:iron(III) transport system ATP-binding protein